MRSALWKLMVAVLLISKVQSFPKSINNDVSGCTAENMFAYISKDFSQPMAMYIYVQDSHGWYYDVRTMAGLCSHSIADTPAYIIFSVSYSSCHLQTTVHGGNITYWLNIAVVKVSYSKQESTFKHTFSSFYKMQTPPVMHTLGEPVFVEVFVLKHEDKDLELVLNECWATPSPDPHDELRWILLHGGCPRQDADYTVEVLEVGPADEVKYPKLHKRLKIVMFSFVESEDIYGSVYLHCDAEVCKRAQCSKTCNKIAEEAV